MSKKIKIFLLGCALMVMCCMGITAGASDNAKVIAHNLTITDEGISVNFYVDIDVEAQNDIKVTLNGSQVEIPAEPTKIIIDAKAYSCYKFTQPVVAKEMDDKVSLSIVAGEEELVTDSYSVNDYVAEVQAGGYGYNFENLANAMTYYGEFAEVYLKYNNATSASEKALASIDGFNEDVLDAYAMTKGSEYPEGLTYYGTQLNLNSEITLRMCFQLADGKTAADYGNITAVSIDGTKDLGVLKKGSYKDTQYYYVDIANIGADVLGKSYEIKAGDKTLLSNCSVLSYANAVVNKYGSDAAKADLANLSKALYLYSEKANLYIESKLVAVYDIFYSSEGFSATPDEFTQVYLTSNGDVTTESTGNTPVTILSQLNDSRTKGCSVWMQTAYTVADAEETFTGPYVIRRYTDNINVLNITGTAMLEATVDGSLGEFAAQYPSGIAKVEISKADNGEVYVSGTLTVKGSAKSGLITTSTADITITADGLTEDAEIIFPAYNTQMLTGTGEASAIKLVDSGAGHFGAIETTKVTEDALPNLALGSIICVCGDNVSEDLEHSCAWTEAQEDGLHAAYAIEWTATTSLPNTSGSYYLTQNLEGLTARTDKNNTNIVNLDLNGKTVSGSGSSGNLYRVRKGTLNIADSQGDGAITMTGGTNTAGAVYVNGTAAYLNIFGGSISANAGTSVTINTGCINMYGGTIIGSSKETEIVVSSTDTSLNFIGANAVQVGLVAAATNSAELNIKGGTIKGEVLIGTNEASSVTISDKAIVGIADESDTDKAYGIGVSSLVTAAQIISCDDVTSAKESIVLKNLEDVTISGTGIASAFEFIKDGAGHFGVYETASATEGTLPTLNVGSVICGCGDNISQDPNHSCAWTTAQGGVEAAYALEWTATTSLPTSAGSYYLTQNMEGVATRSQLATVDAVINFDLAGYTIEGSGIDGMLYRVQAGTFNIADSSEQKIGAIKSTGATNTYGSIAVWGNTSESSYINIFGGTYSAETGTAVAIRRGYINMYGGTILPGEKPEEYAYANAVQVGIGNNGLTNLNVSGGTIKGEVLIYDTSGVTLTVTGDAQVGIKESEQSEKPYGIGTADTVTSAQAIHFSNTSGNVVLKDTKYLALAEGATGDASKFTIIDKHNQVVNVDESETLGYAAYMCVCGKTDGRYDHTDDCEQPAYAWEPWTSTTGLPTDNGSFYLTQNLTGLTTRSNIGSGNDINLDLAGYTVEGTGNGGVLYRIQRGSLNLADSSEEQKGAIRATGESDKFGRALYVWGNEGSEWNANIFGGTLSAEKGVPVTISRGNIHMYGGKILAGTSVEYSGFMLANSVQVGLYTGQTANLNVKGGIITGEVLIANETSSTVTVSDNAKVGIVDGTKAYGIGITENVTSAQTITCNNVTANASVVLKNSHDVTVSGTGEGSAFSIIDPHNKVVDGSDEGIGNLSFAPQMCVCGAVGEHTQVGNCAVPTSAWLPWNATISNADYERVQLPTTSESYYLTEDLSGDNAIVAQTSLTTQRLSIDLAGHTVDASDTAKRIFAMNDGSSATLNITDSVGGGVLKNAQQEKIDVYDGKVIRVYSADATVNLYAGILTAEGTNIAGEEDNNACTVSIAYSDTFNMYGGTVVDNGGEGEDVFKAFNNHSKYNYVDGIVIEDGLYKRGDTANTFRAGYGKTNINPENGVSLGSYSNEDVRKSTGILSDLEAVAIAVTDAENNTLILVVTDLSWGRISDANAIRKAVSKKYGIPKENVLVGGTHNHSAPSAKWTSDENIAYMLQWQENVMAAIDIAIRDRAEATMEVGTTQTVDLVFSRRYLCEDGKYQGGGSSEYDETTAAVKEHESEADEEIQMLRFVREDAKDILIAQWQSHACNISWDRTEGSDHYKASGEWPQIIRSTLEEELGVHCMYMQGAAGNLASMSDIAGENLSNATSDSEAGTIGYNDYVAIGEAVASYVSTAYKATNVFTEVESGLIQINQYKMPVTMRATDTEAEREATEEEMPELNTVAIGNVSLVTLPSELFDTSAQYVKNNTPFAMTLIMGYTCGGSGYEAPDKFWDNGCYEVVHGNYVRGTAELMMQHYVNKLTEFYATK